MKLLYKQRCTTAFRWIAASATPSTMRGSTAESAGSQTIIPWRSAARPTVLTYLRPRERAFHEMGQKEFPEIVREYYDVDATCMCLSRTQSGIDVIVTGNMFGDIITDLGAMIPGAEWVLPREAIQPRRGEHV